MSFTRAAATNFVPLMSRLVLGAAFMTIGWNQIMGEPVLFEGDEARTLRELGIGEGTEMHARVEVRQAALWSDRETPDTIEVDGETVELEVMPELGAPEPKATAGGDGGTETDAPPAAVEADAAAAAETEMDIAEAATEPAPVEEIVEKPAPVLDTPARMTSPAPPAEPETPPVLAAEPCVEARPLHRTTVLIANAGEWPRELEPALVAWVAAGIQLVGGGMLLLGLMSRLWGLGLAATAGLGFYLSSWAVIGNHGFFALPAAEFHDAFAQVAVFLLAFGVMLTGGGMLSLDRMLFGRRSDDDVAEVIEGRAR